MYRQFFGVVLVLSLLVAGLWVLKRRGLVRFTGVSGKNDAGRAVKVIERVPLGAQHVLHVVDINGRRMVISTSPGSCNFITEISENMTREVSR